MTTGRASIGRAWKAAATSNAAAASNMTANAAASKATGSKATAVSVAEKASLSRDAAVDLTAGPRAVIATAAELLYLVGCSVLGADRVPTARDNAWAAVCADRERARVRAEAMRVLSR